MHTQFKTGSTEGINYTSTPFQNTDPYFIERYLPNISKKVRNVKCQCFLLEWMMLRLLTRSKLEDSLFTVRSFVLQKQMEHFLRKSQGHQNKTICTCAQWIKSKLRDALLNKNHLTTISEDEVNSSLSHIRKEDNKQITEHNT